MILLGAQPKLLDTIGAQRTLTYSERPAYSRHLDRAIEVLLNEPPEARNDSTAHRCHSQASVHSHRVTRVGYRVGHQLLAPRGSRSARPACIVPPGSAIPSAEGS